MELKDFSERFDRFVSNFERDCIGVIHENKPLFEEFIREQLYSGKNGKENPLTPTYSDDPYFKEHYGKNWRAAAERYRKWKMLISPPSPSYLGLQPRHSNTPNLIIRGDFYDSIVATATGSGFVIGTQGLSFGRDVERKYGSGIFEIGNHAKKFFIETKLLPSILNNFKSYGL